MFAWVVILSCVGTHLSAVEYRLAETIEIDKVPSWFRVGFCLLSHESDQYVAYYNDQHQMMVASRQLGQQAWQKVELPSKIGWDSHNYVTMAVDSGGYLHLSGNMHVAPLVYFRTREPGDIRTFEKRAMTGEDERQCTYPRFLRDAEGQLLFSYRSGRSGNGKRIYNRYDVATQTWSRFLNTPLFDGQGKRNAYPVGPIAGRNGDFHVAWVWRDSPDCATNHDLSFARLSQAGRRRAHADFCRRLSRWPLESTCHHLLEERNPLQRWRFDAVRRNRDFLTRPGAARYLDDSL
jgi:hypothetical protein